MAGPQAQRSISHYQQNEGSTSAARALHRHQTMVDENVEQHHRLQHVEISVEDDDDDSMQTKRNIDVERGAGSNTDEGGGGCSNSGGGGGGGGEKRVRHRHHRRPLYRRVISYIRNAWTAGVNFSSSNGMLLFVVIIL